MGTKNYVSELEYSDAKGLDTTSPENLMAPGYVREALNVNLGNTGGYIKRDGFTEAPHTVSGDKDFKVRQGFEFKIGSGDVQQLLYATDDFSESKIVRAFSNTTADIKTGFSLEGRPSFAQLKDTLFIFDNSGSIVPQVYEQEMLTNTRTMGIKAPLTAPANQVTSPSIGGSLEEGQYVYAYTYVFYYNNQLIAESSPSEPSEVITTTDTNKTITIDISALPSEYTGTNYSHLSKKIRIYRTFVNGNVLFLETEIAYSSTSHSSNTSDYALQSEQLSLDNTRLEDHSGYNEARFPVIARNRLFIFHPTANKGRFSKIGFNGPLPESFPVVNEFSVDGQFGAADAVIGAGQIKGIPIVLKERSIGRLEEVGLPDLGRNEDPVAYIYREISEHIGAVSHFAQTQVFDELIFLGRDNVYATDGQTIRPIARTIQETIKNCDFRGNRTYKLSAINDTKNRRIYIQVYKDTSALEPNLTLVGDYQQYPDFRWTTYGEGEDAETHPGIIAGCFFQTEATANGGLDIYFGNTSGNSKYYKMNTGTIDNQDPIYMKVVSRPYMFGQPMVQKLYKNARIFVQAADDSYWFSFCSIFDLGSEEEFCQDFKILGVGTTWDDYSWEYSVSELELHYEAQLINPSLPDAPDVPESDDLIWVGPGLQEKVYDPHRKAKTMQLVFKQTDANAPLTLLGWGVSGSIFSGI